MKHRIERTELKEGKGIYFTLGGKGPIEEVFELSTERGMIRVRTINHGIRIIPEASNAISIQLVRFGEQHK